jgi:FtsP/CotA-like multicopper oxidase with cupredoxin domain
MRLPFWVSPAFLSSCYETHHVFCLSMSQFSCQTLISSMSASFSRRDVLKGLGATFALSSVSIPSVLTAQAKEPLAFLLSQQGMDAGASPVGGQINGQTPAPSIQIVWGQPHGRYPIENRLSVPARLVLHGVQEADHNFYAPHTAGQPLPEQSFKPPFHGTYIYRVDAGPQTDRLWAQGMAGMMVVKPEAASPFDAEYNVPLLTGAPLQPLSELERMSESFHVPLHIGGLAASQVAGAGQRILLRMANLSPWRIAVLRVSDATAHIMALDGRGVPVFQPARGLLLIAPGGRMDVALTMPLDVQKSPQIFSRGAREETPLITFKLSGSARAAAHPTDPMPYPEAQNLPAMIRLQDAVRPLFKIKGDQVSFVDSHGKARSLASVWHSQAPAVFSVKRGIPIVFALENQNTSPGLLHVSDQAMRLLHPYDDGWEPYWLDTMIAAAQKPVRGACVPTRAGLFDVRITAATSSALATWARFEVI